MKKILILAACALLMVGCSKTSVFAEQAEALKDFTTKLANVKSMDDLKQLLPDLLAKLNPAPAEENAEEPAPEPTAEETQELGLAQDGVLKALEGTGLFTDSIAVEDNVKKILGDMNWDEVKKYLESLVAAAPAEEAPAEAPKAE